MSIADLSVVDQDTSSGEGYALQAFLLDLLEGYVFDLLVLAGGLLDFLELLWLFLLFGRSLYYFPQVVFLVWTEIVHVQSIVAEVVHMLLHTLLTGEFQMAVYALKLSSFLSDS